MESLTKIVPYIWKRLSDATSDVIIILWVHQTKANWMPIHLVTCNWKSNASCTHKISKKTEDLTKIVTYIQKTILWRLNWRHNHVMGTWNKSSFNANLFGVKMMNLALGHSIVYAKENTKETEIRSYVRVIWL